MMEGESWNGCPAILKAGIRTMDTRSSMLPLLITSVNEEAESYNGGEDHSRGNAAGLEYTGFRK